MTISRAGSKNTTLTRNQNVQETAKSEATKGEADANEGGVSDAFEVGGQAALPGEPALIPSTNMEPISAHSLQLSNPPDAKKSDFGLRVELSQHNDNFPQGMVGGQHSNGNGYGDDDGWTAEVGAKFTATQGDQQLVAQGRLQMVTERANLPGPGGYGARREDITEFAVQFNQKELVNPNTEVFTGFGVGLQRMGPQGLDKLQQWFHTETQGTLGGRMNFADPSDPYNGLQSQYSTDSVRNTPILTGGIGVMHEPFKSDIFSLTADAEATIPLGKGLGSVRANAGFELRPIPNLVIDGGVNLTGSYVTTDQLDFIAPEGVRPGANLGMEYQLGGRVGLFANVEVGGLRDEPVYQVGLVFGLGKKPKASWLDPLR